MIAFLTLELRIEHAQSLKDKRQVVRSLKDRLRAHFNVAVAELDSNETGCGIAQLSAWLASPIHGIISMD